MESALRNRIRAYEDIWRQILIPRTPICLRLDGRAFHTLTHNWVHPWDNVFKGCMDAVAIALCKEVQGAQIAYIQSDEVTIFVNSYTAYETQPWRGGGVQKIVSLSAGIATLAFNIELQKHWGLTIAEPTDDGMSWKQPYNGKSGVFDSRVFAVPREEVCNVFIDRQIDCERNSVLALGQFILGKKSLHKMSCEYIKTVLRAEALLQLEDTGTKGFAWEDAEDWQKYGRIVTREEREWIVKPAPVFTENRSLIDNLVWPEDEEGQYSRPLTIARKEEP